jgi:hypothetical protein
MVVLVASAYAILPQLRRDPIARFWGTGATLSVVPVTASFPSDRLLLFVSLGAMGLIARVIAPLIAPLEAGPARPRAIALVFAGWHLGCAPLLLPLRAAQMQVAGYALERANTEWQDAPNLAERTVVIVNAPVDVFASYLQAELAWKRRPEPRHLYWLTSAGSPLQLTRTGERSLSIEREGGFLSTPLERHYRAQFSAFSPSWKVQLSEMSVEVGHVTQDHRPLAVNFRFQERLESNDYLFLVWRRDRYERLTLPELGRSLDLPAEDWGTLSFRTALSMR